MTHRNLPATPRPAPTSQRPGRNRRRLLPLAALLLAAGPALAVDGAQAWIDHGCQNCHANTSHTAPTLQHLTKKMVARGDQAEALQHRLQELRNQPGIHGHQSVSDESLQAILHWLAQGAK